MCTVRSSGWRPAGNGAFSLIEVIIAIAVWAGSIVVILALLPGLGARNTEITDRMVAQRLAGALQVELQRLAAGGLDGLAGNAPAAEFPLPPGLALVASRDGALLHSRDYLPPAIGRLADGDQYFLVECWRLAEAPLADEPPRSALALMVRVTWPYRRPDSASPTPLEFRHEVVFTMGVGR